MARPIHDELWSTLSLARNMLGDLDMSRPTTQVSTASQRLILETLIRIGANRPGAEAFTKHVQSRIETVGKAQADIHGKFADEQTYVANKIAAEEAQA